MELEKNENWKLLEDIFKSLHLTVYVFYTMGLYYFLTLFSIYTYR